MPTYFQNTIFSTYPLYPLIQHHPSLFSWETFEEEEKKTVLSPLFQSLSPEEAEEILSSYYSADFILEEMEKIEEGEGLFEEPEDFLTFLSLQIQEKARYLILTSKETAEILLEIPLSAETLNSKLEDLIPEALQPFSIIFM